MRKPPTIHDVAGALGMAKSTVSLALSGKGTLSEATRARVLSVAQRLANGHQNHLVCLFSGVLDVGLATEKILLIQKELTTHALEVPIYTCPGQAGDDGETQTTQIKQLCRQRPRAIVCAAPMVHPAVFRELEAYQRTGGIVVSYDVPVPLACDQVIFDREHNAYQAARHLLERGHRRIGIGISKTGPLSDTCGDPQTFRLKGFRRALGEWNVPTRDEWFFQNPTYERGGAEMARHFLQLKERPTGLCIVNDYVALAFMIEVMRAKIRVPQDVSVVGHDDQPIAAYCPVPLTAVSQPVEQIARAVVELLIERIDGSDAPPRIRTIQGKLAERESVAAPPA